MKDQTNEPFSRGTVSFSRIKNEMLLVRLGGTWEIHSGVPAVEEAMERVDRDPDLRSITFDSSDIVAWDSSLPAFLAGLKNRVDARGITMTYDGLPHGVVRLLKIAAEAKYLEGMLEAPPKLSFVGSIGAGTLSFAGSVRDVLAFAAQSFLAFFHIFKGSARYRPSDMTLFIYECGAQALPIVSLISILVGLILGFVGTLELKKFGAQIFIADLVGISMAREMGPMMTAIIMTGRTGAAYATQIGTMETNEEIDALKTLGFSPLEFLVAPRMLALVIMMPLLCVYADVMGILGGGIVGVGLAGITTAQYYGESVSALSLTEFTIGVVKSIVYAVLIALSGCFYGIRASRSAMAVGYAATRAVVTGIVLIVVADGIFAVITNMLNI
jgi:phospholipid/cholesterol/gamma-HCH transport system permease protein